MYLIGLSFIMFRSELLNVLPQISFVVSIEFLFERMLKLSMCCVKQGERGRRGRSKPCQGGTPGNPGLRGESVRHELL